MKKRILTLVLAAVMVLGMSVPAFAAGKADTALATALKNAGVTKTQVKKLEVEKDVDKFDVEFVLKSSGAKYDYEISLSGKKILEKSVEYTYKHNSSKEKIGVPAARKKVVKFSKISLDIVKSGTVSYKYSDKEGVYTFRFVKGSYRFEYEVLAPTGEIIKWEKELINR